MTDSPFDLVRDRLPTPVGLQIGVLALPPEGHHVILGTAGSGKTTMAMLRALQLADARTEHYGRTLLVTFNRSLLAYLNHVLQGFPTLDVRTYHRFAVGYMSTREDMPYGTILTSATRREQFIADAARETAPATAILDRGPGFFAKEIEWIARHGVRDLRDYLLVERVGRGQALGTRGRRAVWAVRDRYLDLRAADGKRYDWHDLADAVCREMGSDHSERRYTHVVIDEGQDFSPQMVRSLTAAVRPGGSVTFFGDVAQQIYGRGVSWRSAGLTLPAAGVLRLKRNHRNSPQIARVAQAIADMPYFAGEDDLITPDQFADAGPPPALVCFSDDTAEQAWIITQARRLGATGSVGVLFHRHADADAFTGRCLGARKLDRDTPSWAPDPGIWACTVHGAKGFEFQAVIVAGLSAARWPEPYAVQGDGEDDARADDGRLLYVAVTRARQVLLMTFTGTLTALMPENDDLWQEQEG